MKKGGWLIMGFIHCNLRVLMAQRELNIQKVKDKTTLSRTTISNLYNNISAGIQFDTLKELCELLKCQPGDLLTHIDVDVEFEVLNENPDISVSEEMHAVDNEGNSYYYVSRIRTDLDIHCKLVYKDSIREFNSQVDVTYFIDEKKSIRSLRVGIPAHFENKLCELKFLARGSNYIYENLDDFLIEWGCDYFCGEEIENADVGSIDRHFLRSKTQKEEIENANVGLTDYHFLRNRKPQ